MNALAVQEVARLAQGLDYTSSGVLHMPEFYSSFLFETKSHYLVLAGLELAM